MPRHVIFFAFRYATTIRVYIFNSMSTAMHNIILYYYTAVCFEVYRFILIISIRYGVLKLFLQYSILGQMLGSMQNILYLEFLEIRNSNSEILAV